jgi:ElaB/YqjD/DUF883 family membrane-anchored ribosome-binding protein
MTITDSIKNATGDAAEQIGNKGRELASEADEALRRTAGEQAQRVSSRSNRYLATLSDAVESGASHLRSEGYDMTAEAFTSVSTAIGRTADRVDPDQTDRLVDRVLLTVERHPLAACGVLAGAGLLLSSLLRNGGDTGTSGADSVSSFEGSRVNAGEIR